MTHHEKLLALAFVVYVTFVLVVVMFAACAPNNSHEEPS